MPSSTNLTLYLIMVNHSIKKPSIPFFFRRAPCEGLGSAKRRPASGVTEEPSQNCHKFGSQQQRTETAVSFSWQVNVKRMHVCHNKERGNVLTGGIKRHNAEYLVNSTCVNRAWFCSVYLGRSWKESWFNAYPVFVFQAREGVQHNKLQSGPQLWLCCFYPQSGFGCKSCTWAFVSC